MKKKIDTPVLLQMHASECGAACLGMVLAYFGRWAPLTELREKCEVSRDGSSAAGILRAARHYGLECKGLSLDAGQLKQVELPLILFWQFNHFIVLEGFDGRNFYLNDPATGKRKVTEEEFVKGYSRVALRFKRGPDFQAGGKRPGLLQQLGALLRRLMEYACRGGCLRAYVGAVGAGHSRVPQRVCGRFHGRTWGLGRGGGSLARRRRPGIYPVLAQATIPAPACSPRVSVIGYNRTMSRLLRLPVEFFAHRLAGRPD